MRFSLVVSMAVLALSSVCHGEDKSAPTKGRVGFPKDYAGSYAVLRAVYKPKANEIVTVYGNPKAATISELSELPYPYGSVIVMEKAKAVTDADGNAILDAEGRLRKAEVKGLHVMKRQRGFGAEYGENRTGDWEYVEYRPDGTYITSPAKSAVCAECHKKAGADRDWVFLGRFFDAP